MKSTNKGFGGKDKGIKRRLSDDFEYLSQIEKATIFAREGKLLDAEIIYRKLIKKGKFNHSTFHGLAFVYERLGRIREAFDSLINAIKLKKNYAEGYADLGRLLQNAGDIKNALNYYELSLKYNPNLFGAYLNKGNIFAKLGSHKEALDNYLKALEINNNVPMIFHSIGIILAKEKKYIEAELNFQKALKCDANAIYPKIELIKIYLETLNFEQLNNHKLFIDKVGLLDGEEISNLLTFFYLNDSPKKQYLRALNFNKKMNLRNNNLIESKKNKRIRIGYISANFNDHPVSKVMEAIFIYHDRSKYEIFAYSLNETEDEITKKLKNYFNSFVCIQNLSLSEAVTKIRSDNIDIAIDLMGHTSKNMIKIFNERIAPKQVNYLGFPGTTGVTNIDFLIADEFLIPKDNHIYYSEKIIQLPNSYVNSIKYEYFESKKDPSIISLPKGSFLLAAFHQTSKLSDEVLDCWIKILSNTENTYLWLKNLNIIAKKNLMSFFKSKDIDMHRILFAENVDSYEEHLSRYSSADIFLDTFNYNGHSTLVECIWSELPFVTFPGESFASRVGGSILHSLGLDELICESHDEYVDKVIFYSLNKEKLKKIKNKIKLEKKVGKFFDQKKFTKDLEKTYERILEISL